MAENKEYQVKVTELTNRVSTGVYKTDFEDYLSANRYYRNSVVFYKRFVLDNSKRIEIQLIEILNEDESITLKSHSYGKK